MKQFCKLSPYTIAIRLTSDSSASDVLGKHSDVDVYLYDRANQEAFLGHVNVSPNVFGENSEAEGWYKLEARDPTQENVTGEINLKFTFERTTKKKYGLEDFEFLKLVGKGTLVVNRQDDVC